MQGLKPGGHLSPRFKLLQILGVGGMGEVWLAHDEELAERVALKVLNAELAARPDALDLLRREARSARRLVHPHVVRVYDFHRLEGHAFLSMEYLPGGDVGALKGVPLPRLLETLIPIADALAHAHELGIVHRDVKASNILLDGAGRARLTDFGIAGVLEASGMDLRISGAGSPRSMSPQQAAGSPPAPSDDIYALGVLLFELLPPQASGPARDLVRRMTAAEPEDRPESMVRVRDALRAELVRFNGATLPPATTAEVSRPSVPPPGVTAPGAESSTEPSPPALGRRRRGISARLFVPALVVALLLVLGTFLLLPRMVSPPPGSGSPLPSEARAPEDDRPMPQERASASETRPPATEVEQPAGRAARDPAEEALAELLGLRRELETKAVEDWAAEPFNEAVLEADRGDEALLEGDYSQARGHYRRALEMMRAIAEGAGEALVQALERGRRGLENGHGEDAEAAFRVALALEPGNAEAEEGLERARRIEEVFALYRSGEAHEEAGRLAMALADFESASALDPRFPRADQAAQRIKARIATESFQAAMSEGLVALKRKDYREALEHFRVAEAFRPESKEVLDGMVQAREGIRQERIDALRRRATELERQERWAAAAAEYKAALAIDPSLVFARDGQARSLRMARLNAEVEYLLGAPDRLTSERVRGKTARLLSEAEGMERPGPRLKARLERLQSQLVQANTPLTVEILSDEATEVLVYKVGRLGRFKTRTLSLKPGNYVVVGSRPGYKDVRRELKLVAGQPAPTLFVACEEPI